MDDSSVFKIWGTRQRLLLTRTSEIDLLNVKKNYFCSTHTHSKKINRFAVIKGAVRIETERGSKVLKPGDIFEVRPPVKHRFFAVKDSIMVELAFVEKGKIDPNDINRESIGGKVIKGKEYTEPEMKKKGMLEL